MLQNIDLLELYHGSYSLIRILALIYSGIVSDIKNKRARQKSNFIVAIYFRKPENPSPILCAWMLMTTKLYEEYPAILYTVNRIWKLQTSWKITFSFMKCSVKIAGKLMEKINPLLYSAFLISLLLVLPVLSFFLNMY
jgi:hypothetical protein